MKKLFRFCLLFLFFLSIKTSFATHNRAGEITYQWIGADSSDLTYRVTITTFTKTSSFNADRPKLDSVYWGDGTSAVVFDRIQKINLANDISKNIYENTHTYLGNGIFKIHFTDPNRNANVVNIPNSVSVPFYLESILVISPFLGQNNSPILTNEPIDQGCTGRIFIHNPVAFDPDPKDSLSYELTICGGSNGAPIGSYSYPAASGSFILNPVTGDLIWDSPIDPGEYNVAFNIIQWRNGNNIGLVRRDMQILIQDCSNHPPVIDVISDTCVLAGDTLSFDVTAIDPDQDTVVLSAIGGILDGNLVPDPALFNSIIIQNDTVISNFNWATNCSHVRPQPYFVEFKAVDIPHGSTDIPLVDLKGTFIRVIAPAPPSVMASPNGSSIDLNWTPPLCSGIAYYNIYRRNGLYPDTIHCPCDNGATSYTGYTLIGSTTDGNDTTFTDTNNGQGLTIGIQYCYLITAVYPTGSESCASQQTCTTLKKDAPVITNADVRFTDVTNGSVYVAWSKPTELDTVAYPGPYEYRVYRSPGFFGANFTNSPIVVLNNLNDTTYIDTLIDTKTNPWSYKIELYYTDTVFKRKGQTGVASTIFLKITPTDNALNLTWTENVPWSNLRYDIFKQNASLQFDSIASVNTPSFTDTGLVNGNTYCYYIRSSGTYYFIGFVDPIINRSQQVCETPFDNVSPCSPRLNVSSDCNNDLNVLNWTNPNNTCADDVLGYLIYFTNSTNGNFELIDSLNSPTDTFYIHDKLTKLSGCYKVAAYDSVHNETISPEVVCVDTCRQYVLPSVFTPDGNGKNDLFHPCDSTTALDLQVKNCPPYKNVKSVEMKIYNRWGNLVFETKDKNINWNGNFKETNKECPEGVYFYVCKVFFFSVTGEPFKELHGTVELIR